jgi:hypothetical protein
MFDGTLKSVEDIQVGDTLMGPNSRRRRVVATHTGTDNMYRINPIKGDSWVVNSSHVLSLVRTNDLWKDNASIVNVSVNEWMTWSAREKNIHKLFRTNIDFPKQIGGLSVDPYILGVLLGDGSMKYSASVTTADDEVRKAFIEYGSRFGLASREEKAGGKSKTIFLPGTKNVANPIANILKDVGIWGSVSSNKFIPQEYKTGSREVRLAVLAGILDTDGYMHCNGFDFISKSIKLSEDVVFICRSLGLAAYLKECQKTCTNSPKGRVTGTYYRVSISGDCSIIPCKVPRKRAGVRGQKKNVLRTGFSVEPVGVGEYFGFTLNGDGLYLLADFTVTHNSGKTVVFTHGVIAPGLKKGSRSLVLVHRKELIEQALSKLEACDIKASVIRADDPRYDATNPVQVATIETLLARDIWPKADIVIADEVHHYGQANSWSAFQQHYPKAVTLGFTATPATTQGTPLEGFDAIVVASTYRKLIAEGHLVPCEVFIPQGLSHRLRGKIAMDPALAFNLYSRGRPGLVFLASVAECYECNEKLKQMGYRTAAVVGERPKDRDAGIAAFRNAELDVLCSVGCLTEGFDAPRAKVAVSGRGLGTVSTMIQLVGRILRPDGISTYATWVDLSGASIEHGHPCDDREYSITPGDVPIKPHSTLAALWQCKHCWWTDTKRPADNVCPFCSEPIEPWPSLKLSPRAFARMVAWTCPNCTTEHYHTPLNCSRCGMTTPRFEKASKDTQEERVAYLRKLFDQARVRGWNVWSAKHRFRGKYGTPPTETEWRKAGG